ncbi:MAG: ATP synthase F1 subunit epsilon [Schleiferiaceae bacterium]|jgi:F-type H+-transporting ATPase subunit epsilon
MALHVDIISPERNLYSGTANAVQLPGTEGLFQILTDHAPLMAALTAGRVKIDGAKGSEFVEISGGVVEVSGNNVTVLAK